VSTTIIERITELQTVITISVNRIIILGTRTVITAIATISDIIGRTDGTTMIKSQR
jgi:hypothetical protein